jgi:hypothetical protein
MSTRIFSIFVLFFIWTSIYSQNNNDSDWDKNVITEGFVQDGDQILLNIPVLFPHPPLSTEFMPNPEFRRVGIGTEIPRAKLHVLLSEREQQLGINPVIISSGGHSLSISGNAINSRTTSPLYLNAVSQTEVVVPSIQITGGSDLAELFEIYSEENIQPGMVVVIDINNPGALRLADCSYDRTVAGVISGANGLNPGVTMYQEEPEQAYPVALTGRVYCMVDATNGAVHPGDLLTTSNVSGHAMKVVDHEKAQGAILGKAMSSLETGRGLVLVLVTLQ